MQLYDAALYVLFFLIFYMVLSCVLWCVTWMAYLANMCTYWAPERLAASLPWRVRLVRGFGEVTSTALNWLVFTVVLLEWPREKFLSTRLARHLRSGSGWRCKLAARLAAAWLDPFDPSGKHI